MSEKPRYNVTYSDVTEWFPQYTQLILFDRKTCKTLRLKVPAKFNQNATEFFKDLSAAVQYSIQSYAKYKREPQSISLFDEQLYFQKTARFMTENKFDYFDILNSTIWEG